MAKFANDAVMDAALDEVAAATLMVACTQQPTTRAEAVTTYALADVAMAGGDFTKANGDTSGRKVTVAAKNGVTVDSSGTATHVALVDATNLIYVTTCDSLALTATSTVDFPAWDVEIADPS